MTNVVQNFIDESIKIKNNHISAYSKFLIKEDLHTPRSLDNEVTDSTIAPFSEKLMVFHTGFLMTAAISYYGTAAVACMRGDLTLSCEKSIMADFKVYGAFGKLVIKKNWLEEPPAANDRQLL
ncbi:DUF3231 family protein [Peribacillus deserti]|uniref:DUF3231 domain-containing protein n=1 Tax=Peribacillus deserti TaxID=673318 RepID=A0A2N5M2T3_9BACI|nr:DUF3231 family protein [Peribacillus deserti]PLT28667.1 hypothetical protein CUU66_17370 [Peribacillus deserti]